MKREAKRWLAALAAMSALVGTWTVERPARADAPGPVLIAAEKGDIGDGTSPVKPVKKG